MRMVVIGIFLALLSALGMSGLESLRFRIPDYQELTRSVGVAFFDLEREYKRGLPLGIKTNSGPIYVTCRITPSRNQDCVPREDRAILAGKTISVLWSEQPIFLWLKERRAFQIEVDGKTYAAYNDMVARYEQQIPDWFFITISTLALIILACIGAYLIFNQSKASKAPHA